MSPSIRDAAGGDPTVLVTSRPDARVGGYTVVSADVVWEDCDRRNRTVYACVPAVDEIVGRAEWMALSTTFIAARYGERRVRVDLPVDPLVRRGLGYAMEQLRLWYGAPRTRVEAGRSAGPSRLYERGDRVAALFVSGGVDSWAALLRNRHDVDRSHPSAYVTGLHVDWMGPTSVADLPRYLSVAGRRWELSAPGRALATEGLTVAGVVTNTRRLDGNVFHRDWMFSDHGAMFTAVAHLLTGRVWSVSIASTYDLKRLGPWGSHPLLDPWYGSTGLRVLHDSPDLSRMDKLRLLTGRPEVVAALDVCAYWFERGELAEANCGRCEKCLRTLMGLEALGVDTAGLAAFAPADRVAAVGALHGFQDEYERGCWVEILDGLRARDHRYRPAVEDLMRRADVRNPVPAGGRR